MDDGGEYDWVPENRLAISNVDITHFLGDGASKAIETREAIMVIIHHIGHNNDDFRVICLQSLKRCASALNSRVVETSEKWQPLSKFRCGGERVMIGEETDALTDTEERPVFDGL